MTIAVMDRRLLLFSRPGWVLPGASVDINFAGGLVYGGTLSSLLSITRAGANATNLLPTSASGAAYTTFAANKLRIDSNGLLIEESRTNNLLNSTAPATQTTASLGTGSYTLWVNGTGSALASAGTATITGASSASNGSPNTFTVTVAGTVTITVTGSLNAFQLEAGTFGTSLIVTAGATATRAADVIVISNPLLGLLIATQGWIYTKSGPEFGVASGGSNEIVGGTTGTNNSWVLARTSSAIDQTILSDGTNFISPAKPSGTNLTTASIFVGSWKVGGASGAVNGGTVATNAAVALTGFSAAWLGSQGGTTKFTVGYISRIASGSQNLTSAQIQSLGLQ